MNTVIYEWKDRSNADQASALVLQQNQQIYTYDAHPLFPGSGELLFPTRHGLTFTICVLLLQLICELMLVLQECEKYKKAAQSKSRADPRCLSVTFI